ncbi:hypothetical protein [Cysteiniphilum sp. 6C5]|uniref:hypothetical protein n=1 Tax=unclassified Cysteiniphilum TaxID=2610889 RepID=UPI003F82C78D
MIRKNSTSVTDLLSSRKNKKGSLLHTIKQQHELVKTTEQKLLHFDIPYFNHTKVCFYNGKKLVLKTEIPELIAKFRELKKQLIALLNTSEYFKDLNTLELVLVFEPKKKTTSPEAHMPNSAQNAFKNLAKTLEDGQIKHAINNLLKKHHHE